MGPPCAVMRVLFGMGDLVSPPSSTVLVMGTFDGVHRGHQALFELGARRASAIGAEPWALTFEPHPSVVLGPELAPPLLCTMERRLELIAEQEMKAALVLRFDKALAETPCEEFFESVVLACGAREVVVGYDFTFGKGRAGDAATLRDLGARHGVAVNVVPPVSIEGGIVPSSTRIRQLVLEGRVEAAAKLLGRPHEVCGTVVSGEGRGRTIGFPTANIDVDGPVLLPANGVYAARVELDDSEPEPAGEKGSGEAGAAPVSWWAGAANIGTNPTFTSGSRVLLEIHLLDYSGPSLVGKRVRALVLERLRPERRFESVDDLVAQIERDVEKARYLAGGHSGESSG